MRFLGTVSARVAVTGWRYGRWDGDQSRVCGSRAAVVRHDCSWFEPLQWLSTPWRVNGLAIPRGLLQ